MNLIIKNIDELKQQFGYETIEQIQKKEYVLTDYGDSLLNGYQENVIFLEILRNALHWDFEKYADFFLSRPEIKKESVLYSEYYWNHCWIERAKELSVNAGNGEEWEFWLIEQIDHCENIIDCDLLEKLQNNEI